MEKLKRCCDQRLRDSRFERDRGYGVSWPQRSYRCSFCSKEFMSAQALGGHMNVHRRDRARMRLYPNNSNPNPNPNPNPRFSSFSDVMNISPSSPSLQQDGVDRRSITALVGKHNEGGVLGVRKAKEFVGLDLNLGSLIQDANEDSESDLDLDLELRL